MRILVLHSVYRVRGGEDAYVQQQVDLLRSAGHDVRLESRDNADLPDNFVTAARMTYGRADHQRMARLIGRHQPDVVHLHNPYPSFGPSAHLGVPPGIPLVQTAHNFRLRCPNGLMFTEGAACTRCLDGRYDNAIRHHCFPTLTQSVGYATALWVHRFVLHLDQRVERFIAPSDFVRRRLLSWGIEPQRVSLVPYFADAVEAPPPVGECGTFVGRLSSEKGVDVLLRALALLGDPPFEIVGSGLDEARLHRLARGLRLGRTKFAGRLTRPEVREALLRARYVVYPSRSEETAGLAALEAMSAARPVVASALGGLVELAQAGRGRLCDPGSPEALAQAIAGYADDAAAAQSDGERAWSFVRTECSAERHLAGLVEAYREAAASATARVGQLPAAATLDQP